MRTTNHTNSTNEEIRKTYHGANSPRGRSEGSDRRRNILLLFHSCDSSDSWLPRSLPGCAAEWASESAGFVAAHRSASRKMRTTNHTNSTNEEMPKTHHGANSP